jgi:hypothetical protein
VTGAPQTGYAQTSDGSYVAFETRGDGPLDLLEVSNGTLFCYTSAVEQPAWMDYVERLASFSRRDPGRRDPPRTARSAGVTTRSGRPGTATMPFVLTGGW